MIQRRMQIKNKSDKTNIDTVRIKNYANKSAITLVALTITIIILLVLAGVTFMLTIGEGGLLNKTDTSVSEYNKKEATEAMNLKITSIQIQSYEETQNLPTLQYLADKLCEDSEIEYVIKKVKEVATVGEQALERIDVSDVSSIFTKIKKYPYEFEIDSNLRLASINGVKVASGEQIPEGYIKPSGTIEITENGEHDVIEYEKANINVPTYQPNSKLQITEKNSNIDVSKYQYVDTTKLFTANETTGEGTNWKKQSAQIDAKGNLTYNCGYQPRLIFIVCESGDAGELFNVYSFDSGKTWIWVWPVTNWSGYTDNADAIISISNNIFTLKYKPSVGGPGKVLNVDIWTIK